MFTIFHYASSFTYCFISLKPRLPVTTASDSLINSSMDVFPADVPIVRQIVHTALELIGHNRLGKNGKPESRYQHRTAYKCQTCSQTKYKGHPCTKVVGSKQLGVSTLANYYNTSKQRQGAAQRSVRSRIVSK